MSRQQAILEFISSHNKEKGYSPTFREIGEAVGLKSSSTVYGHIERLERRGLIRHKPSLPRTLEVISEQSVSEVQVIEVYEGLPVVVLYQGRKFVYDPMG
jgi:repressor LexA